jgi:hypothetical protein
VILKLAGLAAIGVVAFWTCFDLIGSPWSIAFCIGFIFGLVTALYIIWIS